MPSNSNHIIAMTCDLELIQAAEGEATGPKKFAVKVYNGGALQVGRWDYPIVIDLTGMKVAKSVVANLDHIQAQRVGHVTNVTNDGKRVNLDGVFSAATPYRQEVIESAADGFPWQASVEVMPTQTPDFIGEGEKVEVNGQKFTGPIQVARKSELYGFGFVSRGADKNTSVTIAAEAVSSKGTNMIKPELKQWIEAQGFDAENVTDVQAAQYERLMKIEAAAANPQAPAPLPGIKAGAGNDGAALMGDDHWDLQEIKAAHLEASNDIEAVIEAKEVDIPDAAKFRAIKASAMQSLGKLKQRAITDKMTIAQYCVEAIKAKHAIELELVRAERPAGPAIHSRRSEINDNILACAVAISGKYSEDKLLKQYGEQTLDAAARFTGPNAIGLQELIFAAARENGYQETSFSRNPNSCFKYAFRPIEAGGFSTVNLSGVLSNVANKFLLAGYTFTEQTWREIASRRPVNNFQTVTGYRMTGLESFEQIGPDGKLKHGTLGDESYTNKASTYGLILSVTRTDIINDDLGAITTVPQAIGRAAGTKLNEVFWATFMNNSAFFTTARANYFEGADSVLGIDSLAVAEQMFMDMVDAKGKPIASMPRLLLTPTNLSSKATLLYSSQEIRDNTANTKTTTANPHVNKYRPVVSRYLNKTGITGYSTTAWYLLADPSESATIEVVFLNGVEIPTIEESATEFDTLGLSMRGYFDFGVAQQDYRVGTKSKGAA